MTKRDCRARRWTTILGLTMAFSGCAGLEYRRDLGQKCVQGIRYYDPSPYILVIATPDGQLEARIEYLPDPNKLMAVQPKVRGAKLDATLTFDRGVLKTSDAKADALVIPKAVLDIAKTVAIASVADQAKEQAPNPRKDEIPGPRAFKLIARGDKWWLVGGDTKPFQISKDAAAGGAQ